MGPIRQTVTTMSDPVATISDLLAPVFAGLNGGEPADPTVRPSERADAQVNGALALAKRTGANPRDIAQAVVDSGVLAGVASELEIAGPGFVNVTLSPEFLAAQLGEVAADDRLGVASAAAPLTVVIDYSAPNVAKEMHVGHLRTTLIGDALVRMFDFLGHDVIRENHIGDWGTPFGMLIEHLVDLGEERAAEHLSLGDLDGFYKEARAAFDASEEFQDRARQRVVLLQGGDDETQRLWALLVELSTKHFNTVYEMLGVHLTDDDLAGESTYQPLMPEVIERLRGLDLLTESDGADVVFPPGFTNRDGDPLPLIVQKGAGGFNYATSDLACVIDRVERLDADLILYVVGAPQQQHFQMVFAVAEMAGWLAPPRRAVHVAFGNVLGPDRKMLKSRTGESMKFVELLDEALERAAVAVDEKNPNLTHDERAEVVHTIGIGAVKYAELSTDRVKDYVFDLGPDAVVRRQHRPLPPVRARPDLFDLPARRHRPGVGALDVHHDRDAAGAGVGVAPARLSVRDRLHARDLQSTQVVHLRLRTGHRLHRLLRALSRAEGRRAAAVQPPRHRRPDRPHAAARPRPARHRRPGADVIALSPRLCRIPGGPGHPHLCTNVVGGVISR
jgi:arginyl-tRNA synthetase